MQARDAIGSRPSDAVGAVSLLADNARKAGFDIASDIVRHVIQGDTLVLPADTFGPCLIVGTVAIANYDLGFDLEASLSAGRVAVGVRAGGPAYKSGLRDGMRLVRRVAGRIGDPTLDTAWIVHADGRERTIRWKPAGQDEVMAQQLRRVVDTPEDAVACGL
jgi:predicted metalloprotease with PDZ domain